MQKAQSMIPVGRIFTQMRVLMSISSITQASEGVMVLDIVELERGVGRNVTLKGYVVESREFSTVLSAPFR
jgi:hypothetical protein